MQLQSNLNGSLMEEFSSLFHFLRRQEEKAYLVGGAVRDMLMGWPVHDLDFVVLGDAPRLARHTANHFHGAFYMLDEQRGVARAILPSGQPENLVLDFSNAHGNSLEKDLADRDFTINAIALDLDTQKTIDPLGGAAHLRAKLLAACNPESFQQDPIRVLRAFRFSLAFGLRMLPQTKAQLMKAVPRLNHVSGERQRDELMRLLAGGRTASAIRMLDHTGILEQVLPEFQALLQTEGLFLSALQGFELCLTVLQKSDQILDFIEGRRDQIPETLFSNLLYLHLGRRRSHLHEYLQSRLNADRSHRGLICLAGLFLPIFAADHIKAGDLQQKLNPVIARLKHLALSRPEIQYFERVALHAHLFLRFSQNRLNLPKPAVSDAGAQMDTSDRRAIYRYFKTAGQPGIDICLLSLALSAARAGAEPDAARFEGMAQSAALLLDGFFNLHDKIIDPPPLINGSDLMNHLSLPSGKKLGWILEQVKEEQAAGVLTTRREALDFARSVTGKPD